MHYFLQSKQVTCKKTLSLRQGNLLNSSRCKPECEIFIKTRVYIHITGNLYGTLDVTETNSFQIKK